ncbi:MAG: hypothetical protein ACKVP7_04625 [Hyphomicrobiaceae bacterium]
MIEAAKRTIGQNERGNRSLEAEGGANKHIARIDAAAKASPAAAPFLGVLQSTVVQEAFKDYEQGDKAADTSQKRFFRTRLYTAIPFAFALGLAMIGQLVPPQNIANFLAGTGQSTVTPGASNRNPRANATMSAQTIAHDGQEEAKAAMKRKYETWLRHLTPTFVNAFLLVAILIAWRTKPNDHYAGWKSARAKAEAMRRELFCRVLDAKTPGLAPDQAAPLLLLKLEYFRRYQLEVQQAYFEHRRQQHLAVLWWTKKMRALFFFVAILWAIVSGLAVLSVLEEQGVIAFVPDGMAAAVSWCMAWLQWLEASHLDKWLLVGSVGLAVMYGIILFYSVLSASARNATRFEPMQDNFVHAGQRLEQVRMDAAQGNVDSVWDFVSDVHAVMSAELNDWVRLAELESGRSHRTGTTPVPPPPLSTVKPAAV